MAALCLSLACATAMSASLPGFGEPGDMDSIAERKLGERIARELYRDPDYVDDAILDGYVQGIWTRLLAAARRRGELSSDLGDRFAWRVLIGRDRSVNAFALPGGWLGLHMGLVAVTMSRDELASVLAHELSHVTQRHISRMTAQQNRQTPLMIAGLLLGILAAKNNPEAANAAIVGVQAVGAQSQLNFSRDMEREADRVGYSIAVEAGFDPQGFVGMFERLFLANRHNDTGAFPYLRTHPLSTERMSDMRARHELEDRASVKPSPADWEHALMAARARALGNLGVDALRLLAAEVQALGFDALPPVRQAAVLYSAALARSRLREWPEARALTERLVATAASDPIAARHARWLAAEITTQAGDSVRARLMLDAQSSDRPELMLWAQSATGSGRAGEVAQRLQTWVALHPQDALAWQLLGQANLALGHRLRAIRCDAEVQAARLNYAAARDRLRAAQDLVRSGGAIDHVDASIIDARARQIDSLLKEQALER